MDPIPDDRVKNTGEPADQVIKVVDFGPSLLDFGVKLDHGAEYKGLDMTLGHPPIPSYIPPSNLKGDISMLIMRNL